MTALPFLDVRHQLVLEARAAGKRRRHLVLLIAGSFKPLCHGNLIARWAHGRIEKSLG